MTNKELLIGAKETFKNLEYFKLFLATEVVLIDTELYKEKRRRSLVIENFILELERPGVKFGFLERIKEAINVPEKELTIEEIESFRRIVVGLKKSSLWIPYIINKPSSDLYNEEQVNHYFLQKGAKIVEILDSMEEDLLQKEKSDPE